MKTFSFEITFKSGRVVRPKGFYYQGKNKSDIVMVGNTDNNSTIRERVSMEEVSGIKINEDKI